MKTIDDAVRKQKMLEAEVVTKALEDESFRKKLTDNPKKALASIVGKDLPEALIVKVLDAAPNTLTIMLPQKPSAPRSKGELSDAALGKVAGGIDAGVLITGITTFGVAALAEV